MIRQAIASSISDSLFLEVRKKKTGMEMWEAVKDQREKKSRMVTVDMRRKLQAEKCLESGDVRAVGRYKPVSYLILSFNPYLTLWVIYISTPYSLFYVSMAGNQLDTVTGSLLVK